MERLFYDGTCALCHWAVRFLLARDLEGHFRFAPLQGATFRSVYEERERPALPDSLVLATEDGRLLTRSEAVLHVLERVGGGWRVLARLGRLVPRRCATQPTDSLRDSATGPSGGSMMPARSSLPRSARASTSEFA